MADGKVTFVEVVDPPDTWDGPVTAYETARGSGKLFDNRSTAPERHNVPRVRKGRRPNALFVAQHRACRQRALQRVLQADHSAQARSRCE
jgi:organic hydroperoxide reductase OsmC/OhrA